MLIERSVSANIYIIYIYIHTHDTCVYIYICMSLPLDVKQWTRERFAIEESQIPVVTEILERCYVMNLGMPDTHVL